MHKRKQLRESERIKRRLLAARQSTDWSDPKSCARAANEVYHDAESAATKQRRRSSSTGNEAQAGRKQMPQQMSRHTNFVACKLGAEMTSTGCHRPIALRPKAAPEQDAHKRASQEPLPQSAGSPEVTARRKLPKKIPPPHSEAPEGPDTLHRNRNCEDAVLQYPCLHPRHAMDTLSHSASEQLTTDYPRLPRPHSKLTRPRNNVRHTPSTDAAEVRTQEAAVATPATKRQPAG